MADRNLAYRLVKTNMRKLFPYQVASFALALVTMVIGLVLVNQMKRLVDALPNLSVGVWRPLLIFGIAYPVVVLVFEYVFRRTQIVGRNEIVVVLFNKMAKKPLEYFRTHDSGEIMSLINNEGREVGDWLSYGVLGLFQLCGVMVLNISLMAYYNVYLAGIVCVGVLVVYASSSFLTSRIAKLTAKSFEVTGKINRLLLQTLKSETVIHMLNAGQWFVQRFSGLVYRGRYPLDRKRMNIHAVYTTIYLFLSVLLPIIVVAVGAVMSDRLGITVGGLLAFYALTAQMQEPLQNIPQLLAQRKSAMSLSEHLMEILQDQSEDSPSADQGPAQLGKAEELAIDIDHFSYDCDSPWLLEGFNLVVHPGDVVVIKGTSGVGKSTLLELISGLLKSDNAVISQNGRDYSTLPDSVRWEHLLLAEQEPVLIDATCRDNVWFGEQFSDDLTGEVLRTACLEDFATPDGLEQPIGGDEDGVSGGQKQRIAIARLLIRRPDVLILDEPTAALDSATSSRLARQMVEYARKYAMMLIIVSHKPDFDPYATKTVEISNGPALANTAL